MALATTETHVYGEILLETAVCPQNENTNNPLVAYKARADPNTMYLHQALHEPDRDKFQDAMVKEVNDQLANGNFEIIAKKDMPTEATLLPAVW